MTEMEERFPTWLRDAPRLAADALLGSLKEKPGADKTKQMLLALTSHKLMKTVWASVYRRPLRTRAYEIKRLREHAAQLRSQKSDSAIARAKRLEREARAIERLPKPYRPEGLTDRDHAAQVFLKRTLHSALHAAPVYVAEYRERCDALLGVATNLRVQAEILRTIKEIRKADKIDVIAELCEAEGQRDRRFIPMAGEHGIFLRRGKDDLVKAIANKLLTTNAMLFDSPLYDNVRKILNVILEVSDPSHRRVRLTQIREWWGRPGKSEPGDSPWD